MAEYIEKTSFIEHLKKDPLFDLVEQYGITGVIESFPAEDVQPVKWIPVTERLPEEDCKILAACSTLHYQRICRFAKNLTEIDKFVFDGKQGFYDYDSERGYYEVGWVTHWMPLPEPPKDGEDGG